MVKSNTPSNNGAPKRRNAAQKSSSRQKPSPEGGKLSRMKTPFLATSYFFADQVGVDLFAVRKEKSVTRTLRTIKTVHSVFGEPRRIEPPVLPTSPDMPAPWEFSSTTPILFSDLGQAHMPCLVDEPSQCSSPLPVPGPSRLFDASHFSTLESSSCPKYNSSPENQKEQPSQYSFPLYSDRPVVFN